MPSPRYPVIDGLKRCTRCDRVLPAEESFLKKPNGVYKAECRDCLGRRSREVYAKSAQRYKDHSRKQWASMSPEDRERYYERARERRAADPDRYRRHDLVKALKSHGLELRDHERLMQAQGGVCAICKEPPRGVRALHIDHDHKTGLVRGLLCHSCNTSLGGFRDDPEALLRAIAYLASPTALRLNLQIRDLEKDIRRNAA